MDWLKLSLQLLTMVPGVVLGIERMSTAAKTGASKKELAMQALGLSYGVASNVAPQHQPAIDAATTLASNAIDNFVALANATRHPDFVKPTLIASPVETPVAVQDAANAAADAQARATTQEFISEHPDAKVVDVPQSGPGLHTAVPA